MLTLRGQGRAVAADMVQHQWEIAWRNADVDLDLAWY
jgi:hypothetical protein